MFEWLEQGTTQLLEQVKLTEAANVRAGSYSGGMKRRLSVAIALIGDPKIVYLDEPVSIPPGTRLISLVKVEFEGIVLSKFMSPEDAGTDCG